MHISMITSRHSDGLVVMVHSAACGSSKFTGTKTYFEKVEVAVQRSIVCALHSRNPTYYKDSIAWACNSNQPMGVALCKPINGLVLCIHT